MSHSGVFPGPERFWDQLARALEDVVYVEKFGALSWTVAMPVCAQVDAVCGDQDHLRGHEGTAAHVRKTQVGYLK